MNFGAFAGNLAGKLQQNINVESTGKFIARLGEVVAPPADDEYDSSEGEYEDGEYYSDEEDSYEDSGEYADEAGGYEDEDDVEEEELYFEDEEGDTAALAEEMLWEEAPLNDNEENGYVKSVEDIRREENEGLMGKVGIDGRTAMQHNVTEDSYEREEVVKDATADVMQTVSPFEEELRARVRRYTDEDDHGDGSENLIPVDEKPEETPVAATAVSSERLDSSEVLLENANEQHKGLESELREHIDVPLSSKSSESAGEKEVVEPINDSKDWEKAESSDNLNWDEVDTTSLSSLEVKPELSKDIPHHAEQQTPSELLVTKETTQPTPESSSSVESSEPIPPEPQTFDQPSKPASPPPPPSNDQQPSTTDQTLIQTLQQQITSLQQQLHTQQTTSSQQLLQSKRLLDEATTRADTAEHQLKTTLQKHQANTAQIQQRQQRAQKENDSRISQTLEALQQKDEEVYKLQNVISDMRKVVATSNQRASQAERQLHEVQIQYEEVTNKYKEMEQANQNAGMRIEKLEEEQAQVDGVKMELQMLKEERERSLAHIQSTVESASSSHAKLSEERDAARAEAQDLQQQLTATLADLEISRTDYEHALLSRDNLQKALEAFQVERDMEMELVKEQRVAAELAAGAAAKAAIEAGEEANEMKMREVQKQADMAIMNLMEEIRAMEEKEKQLKKENCNLRRSLDEAIQRLQMSQEDVIDRTLMKNILLDWHSKRGHAKKDVLELMASVLHFSEDEKEKVGIGDAGTLEKVVGVVAAPLPPAALNIDKIEGESVREKWINFLLAETGGKDDVGADAPPVPTPKRNEVNGRNRNNDANKSYDATTVL